MAPSPPVRAAVISRSRRWRSSWSASSSRVAGVASSWPARRTISGISSASSGASPMTEDGCARWPRRRSAARRVSGRGEDGVEVERRPASARRAPAARRRARGTPARTARGGRAPGGRRWRCVAGPRRPRGRRTAGGRSARRSRRDPARCRGGSTPADEPSRRMPCGSGLMTAPTCVSASSSLPALEDALDLRSARTGRTRSSSARMRSAPPSSPTMSAGSAPGGSGTTRSSSAVREHGRRPRPRPAGPPRRRRGTAAPPARARRARSPARRSAPCPSRRPRWRSRPGAAR